MKTRDEIIDALEQRIKRLNSTNETLFKANMLPNHRMLASCIIEELETLLTWIRD